MRVCRSLLIAVLVFVAGFSLAMGSLWARTCQQDISRLNDELSLAIEARNRAQDNYDRAVYWTLFEPRAQDARVQLSLGMTREDTPVRVEFLVHGVSPGPRWGEGHGLR